jgi:hypothetical protein
MLLNKTTKNICCYKGKNRNCRKYKMFCINNNPLCYNHCFLLYNKFVLTIQRMYKGYKCRRYLKNIFYNLPRDVQLIILDKINKNYNIIKYNNTINNIIIKKTQSLHNYVDINNQNKLSLNYVTSCYRLYFKYHTIIDKNYMKHLFVLGTQLQNLCHILLEPGVIHHAYIYPIYDKLDTDNAAFNDVIELVHIVNKYMLLYYRTHYRYNYY